MSKYNKIKWYRFKVANKIRLLEGDELIAVCEEFIEDIRIKKLDKSGFFKLLIRDLEGIIKDVKTIPKKKARVYDPFHIHRSGDGRIALFGLSNVGKSTLMNAITNTDIKTGDYLNTTRIAHAGTCEYENLKIQILDLPGFLDFKENWLISKQIVRVARTSDAILLVIDLSFNIDRQYDFLMEQLENAKLIADGETIYKFGIIATKGDLPSSKDNFQLLKSRTSFPIYPVSIKHLESLEKLKKHLFDVLDIIRIYTKSSKRKPDLNKPFICLDGATIFNVAEKIHKDFINNFRYAKVWGASVEFPGQHVGLEHILMDSDIVEILINRK
ncbi:MAG: GTPase [Candidatus Hodarchaeales archaeon]|jgi:small GTP-binding protein